ncbi:MAG: sugar ABC transporter substrate-binding protein [Pseudomonadota bacterium]
MPFRTGALVGCALLATTSLVQAETVTIATVNNSDMIRMQDLADDFAAKHPDIELDWVTLEENVLRGRVNQYIAAQSGQFDILTIGNYETPIWAAQGWIEPLDDLPDYDAGDLIPAVVEGLTVDGKLYAAPFYGESAMTMYRTDLAEAAGVDIPAEPTWADVWAAAEAMTDRDNEIYGICLRGLPGWGQNMGFITAMANSYGARWFDEDWVPQLDSPEWTAAVTDYVDMMAKYGPPDASSNGFKENLSLFQQGKCAIWIDATVAASALTNPDDSTVADNVGFALFPSKEGVDNRGNWLWAWSFAVASSSDVKDAAKQFISWATGKDYIELVAANEGWVSVPPGTRTSLYENDNYLAAAPFAEMTLDAMNAATPDTPSVQETPYGGGQFVAIPEYAGIGDQVGEEMAAALAGQQSAEEALANAQAIAADEMEAASY